MPITADCHLHSSYSGDSDAPMEEMVLQGIAKGLHTMCFTEHNDFDYPRYPDLPDDTFLLDTDAYLRGLDRLREKYAGRMRLLFGVELGLQPEIPEKNALFAKSYDFDFIIGSSHICHGRDPWYPGFFEGRDEDEAFGEYFASISENIRLFSDFDVYGHLDYIVRYSPRKDENYSYVKYRTIMDEILNLLLDMGKGVEINTGGLKSGMRDLHPCLDILKRYREMGGEIVTIGSDAHDAKNVAAYFGRAKEALEACGFRHYCTFEKRRPVFHRL